jgi:hypothetical protein
MPLAIDRKQEALREELWPDSASRVWKAYEEKGYCCLPRVLPLLLRLMNDKGIIGGKAGDCGPVYVELLARGRGQGIVELGNEGEHAYLAGYSGTRAVRSWRERVAGLEKAGFIEVQARPNQRVGVVLLVHPHLVAQRLHRLGLVGGEWWATYQRLLREHGATVPREEPKKLKLVGPRERDGGTKRKQSSASKP